MSLRSLAVLSFAATALIVSTVACGEADEPEPLAHFGGEPTSTASSANKTTTSSSSSSSSGSTASPAPKTTADAGAPKTTAVADCTAGYPALGQTIKHLAEIAKAPKCDATTCGATTCCFKATLAQIPGAGLGNLADGVCIPKDFN